MCRVDGADDRQHQGTPHQASSLVLLLIVDTIKYNLRSLQRKQLTAILGKIAYESKYSA